MKSLRLRAFCGLLLLFLAAAPARAVSSVWVVTSKTATLCLAGSCHVLRAGDYPLPPEFDAAFRQSSSVVFETPLDDMQTPAVQAKMLKRAAYGPGETLRQHVSSNAYAKVADFCRKRGYPLAQLEQFRPWMLSMTLMLAEMRQLGIEPTSGVDLYFFNRAKKEGRPVSGLETVDEQLGFLTLIDRGLDDNQIIQAVSELEQLKTTLPRLLAAWRKGDDQALTMLMTDEFKDEPRLYQALIVERNKKWMAQIEKILTRPAHTLLVVGVGHLVGPDGLVAQLRQRGYSVEPLAP